ncbi:MAG: hypothetical protein RID91_13220 [Azospirillaceae bacterium]
MPTIEWKGVRERLRSKSLTEDDIKILDDLASLAERTGMGEAVGDKVRVAQLPGGFDIVK